MQRTKPLLPICLTRSFSLSLSLSRSRCLRPTGFGPPLQQRRYAMRLCLRLPSSDISDPRALITLRHAPPRPGSCSAAAASSRRGGPKRIIALLGSKYLAESPSLSLSHSLSLLPLGGRRAPDQHGAPLCSSWQQLPAAAPFMSSRDNSIHFHCVTFATTRPCVAWRGGGAACTRARPIGRP